METTTQPADQVIATTPPQEPIENFEAVLKRQLTKKPILPPREEIKSLDQIPAPPVPTPSGMDVVPYSTVNEYLSKMEGVKKESPVEEVKKEEIKPKNDLTLDGLDLNKEVVPQEEKKVKKTKEDNIAELRKKAETLDAEVKTRDEKLADYQKKLEQLESDFERVAFEKSPKFREKFAAPYEQALGDAVAFAKEYAEDGSIAEKALSLKGKERIEFIDESFGSGAAAAAFLSKIEKAESTRSNLEAAVENYKETSQSLVKEEEAQRASTYEKIQKNFDKVTSHLASKSDFFRMGDDESHNKVVEERIKAAKNIMLGTASENDMMITPFLAVIAKDAVAENEQLKAELAKYKARAAKDASTSPAPKRGSSEESNVGKPMGAMDRIKSQLRNI